MPGPLSGERTGTLPSQLVRLGSSARPPTRRSRISFVFLAVAFLVGGPPARAGEPREGRILSPGSGETLVAGEAVAIRWSFLPDDVTEMELLLSIDGGRTFLLRLTPQIDPRSGSLRWEVPRVAARAAQLRIRYGMEGEEVEAAPSTEFSIFVPPSLPEAPFVRRDGEWWIAPGDCPLSPLPGFSGAPTIGSSSGTDDPALLPPSRERPHPPVLSSRPQVVERPAADIAGAFGPKARSAPSGTTPARE